MPMPIFFTGFLAGLALIIAIGAQNAFVLRQGIRRQHRLTITAICSLADIALISAGIAGLGALIEAHPGVLALTRYGGATFLAAYGGLAARRAWLGGQQGDVGDEQTTLLAAILTCLGLTFLNPHVYLDTVLLLGSLANQQGDSGRWVFGVGAACASLLWFAALAYGAGALAPLFSRPQAWRGLDAVIALVMLTLSASMVLG